jgi:hypothetical protein
MKKQFTLAAFALTAVGIIQFAELTSRPAATPNGGYAGEPAGNRTCATSGCHSGTPTTDATQFTLKMATSLADLQNASSTVSSTTTFIPNTTYYMSLQLNGTASRYGFSLSALDNANAQAGSFTVTNATSTATVTGASSITNMSHKAANTTKSWEWQWTSPNSLSAVNFYYAGMLSDGTGGTDNDVVYKSSVGINGTNSIRESDGLLSSLQVFPTQTMSKVAVNISLEQNIETTISLMSLTGQVAKVLAKEKMIEGENQYVFDLTEVPQGNYILVVNSGKNTVTKPIIKL